MPIVRKQNNDWEWVDGYVPPMHPGHYDWDERKLDHLKDRRRQYAYSVESCAFLLKELGKARDSFRAKEVKELLKYWQKHEKAATAVIRWIDGYTDDRRFTGWPVELVSQLDEEFDSYDNS